jgi:hypothetical protein
MSIELVTLFGIVVTFGVALANLIHSRNSTEATLYINIITSARIKWMESLRQSVSRFAGLTYHWSITPLDDGASQRIVEECDVLRFMVQLHMNPRDEEDQKVIVMVEDLPNLTDPRKSEELKEAVGRLVSAVQARLKIEWERVKDEAKGDIQMRPH